MSDHEHHCPFLNRADHRCSDFFSIERLQHAFEHCFDAYRSCAVYQELLAERQARRSEAAAAGAGGAMRPDAPRRFVWTTACTAPHPDVKTRFVRIRLPHVTTAADARGGGEGDGGGHAHAAAAGVGQAAGGGGADRYPKPAA